MAYAMPRIRVGTNLRVAHLAAVLTLLLVVANSPARASGDVNVLFGWCNLADDAWGDLQNGLSTGASIGIQFDYAREGWPVHAAASLGTCVVKETEEGLGTEVTISDYAAGVVWFPRKSAKALQPYLGGGMAFIEADIEILTNMPAPATLVKDGDTTSAFYVHGGFLSRTERNFTFGLDLRLLQGSDLTLFDAAFEPGNFQARLIAGYRW